MEHSRGYSHCRASFLVILLSLSLLPALASADGKKVVDTSRSPHVKFRSIDLDAARWSGGFWGGRWEQDHRVTIPTMKQVMELPTNSATFRNLRVAPGDIQGMSFGNNRSDGDCNKWIEAAAMTAAKQADQPHPHKGSAKELTEVQ